MKKILMMAVIALFSTTAVMAQMSKSDKAMWEKSIEKSNADIVHPKRSTKAYTWLDRGKLMYDAYIAPVQGLYDKRTKAQIEEIYGKGTDKGVTDVGNNKGLKTVDYPNFTVYYSLENLIDRVFAWDQKVFVEGASLEEAVSAYLKALELDDSKSTQDEVKKMLGKDIHGRYMNEANNFQDHNNLVGAADMCLAAYNIGILPIVGEPHPKTLYLAGYLYSFSGEFEKGAKYLKEAASLGETTGGDTYYYIAYSYNSIGKPEDAKKALEDGVAKFPENIKIVEMLANIYANGNKPEEHLEFIEKAANMFNKPDLWSAVGRVYDRAGEIEKSVEAFDKALAKNPDDYVTNFNIGLMYVKRGAEIIKEVNSNTYSNQIEYNAAFNTGLDSYKKAMPYLEKSIELNPTEVSYVTFTRDIVVHLRDKGPEYKDKYNKYVQMARDLGADEAKK